MPMRKLLKEIIQTFGILAAIPIVLIGAFAVFALVPLPWVKARIAAKAREGTPLVEAIYELLLISYQ
jgi:ABC-type phosphate transport system permease subunit